ncbi:MAG: hypothetical protein HYV95_04180 [Opitutae bacterium]|nr:hypothetical protein [Opitutae bacterium]
MPADEEPKPRQFTLKAKEFDRVNAPRGAQEPSADHDVYAIRQQIRAREQAAGFDELKPLPPRRSRRRRDYWMLMLLGNGFFGAAALIGHSNPVVFVAGLGGAIIFSIGLTWVMWFIMENY